MWHVWGWRSPCGVLMGKSELKNLLVRPKRRWGITLKSILKMVGRDWIAVVQGAFWFHELGSVS